MLKGHKSKISCGNWTCQTCGATGTEFQPHYKKPWAHHKDLRYEKYGVVLCIPCHKETKTETYLSKIINYVKGI